MNKNHMFLKVVSRKIFERKEITISHRWQDR